MYLPSREPTSTTSISLSHPSVIHFVGFPLGLEFYHTSRPVVPATDSWNYSYMPVRLAKQGTVIVCLSILLVLVIL